MQDELLNVAEVAEVLRLSPYATYELIRSGDGPPVIRLGRRIRIRRAALTQWLAEKESGGTPTGVTNEGADQ